MDRLTPLRVPLATVALAVLTLVAAARVGLGLSELVTVGGSRAVAAARLAPNAGDAPLTVLVGLLIAWCFVGPEVPRRRRLAVWGTVLTVVSLVATAVALGLTNPAVAGWNLVWGLPDLAVPALVGVALGVRGGTPTAEVAPRTSYPEVEAPVAEEEVPVPPDPELQPSWSQDTAAGAVWRTAGEAARGAPAQSWGSADGATWPTPALPAGRDEQDPRAAGTDRTDPS